MRLLAIPRASAGAARSRACTATKSSQRVFQCEPDRFPEAATFRTFASLSARRLYRARPICSWRALKLRHFPSVFSIFGRARWLVSSTPESQGENTKENFTARNAPQFTRPKSDTACPYDYLSTVLQSRHLQRVHCGAKLLAQLYRVGFRSARTHCSDNRLRENPLSESKHDETFKVVDRRLFTQEGEFRKEIAEQQDREHEAAASVMAPKRHAMPLQRQAPPAPRRLRPPSRSRAAEAPAAQPTTESAEARACV